MNTKHLLCSLLIVGLGAASLQAFAAEIKTYRSHGYNVVEINGEIVPGDGERFDAATQALAPPVIVKLSSDGGALFEGLRIGEAVHARKYTTGVAETCASACGLIWIAGAHRLSGPDARIGFHAAYDRDTHQEGGMANAMVGAYLSRLGLSYGAIAFMTAAGPNDMTWLNQTAAAQNGIEYELLARPAPAAEARPKSAARQQAEGTPGYAEGVQARTGYERWFAGLPEGPYRAGVLFWVQHRSLRQPPTCAHPDPAWQGGCNEARDRFTEIDFRRHTDKNFWYGWNDAPDAPIVQP